MQLKRFGDIHMSKHWNRIQSLFQCRECMTLLTTPSPKLVHARENGKRLDDQVKVRHELMVVIHKTQENTKYRHIDQCQDLLTSTLVCCTPRHPRIIICPKYASQLWQNLHLPWYKCNPHCHNRSKTSNGRIDPSHHDQLPIIRFSINLPQVMWVGDSRISIPGC